MNSATTDPCAEVEKLLEDAMRDGEWIFSEVVRARTLLQHVLHDIRPGWRPVETAPHEKRVLTLRRGDLIDIAEYGKFRNTTGWFTHSGPDGDHFVFKVTHWMPLPEAPK